MRLASLSLLIALVAVAPPAGAQDRPDHAAIRQAMLDYIDGFYTGDSTLLVRSVSPEVIKYGYWKADSSGSFVGQRMSYRQIVHKPTRPPRERPGAPREATVLDAEAQVASGKVKAWWGIDYILLARENGRWMIRQVLWQGPLNAER
jgi:hypothetical protein